MKTRLLCGCLAAIAVTLPSVILQVQAQTSCGNLKSIRHGKTTIVSAVDINDPIGFMPPKTPGPFGTPSGLKVTAPFCRVTGYIEPVQDSHIGFEVWLPPAEKWNGNYLAVGNPAFEGAIKYAGLARALEQGYATASTDTGHLDPGHRWAMGHRERLIDWTHRAVHETTVVAKRIVEAFYGRSHGYAYWDSCHNGGRQGLVEAQRYPEDFDGIVAGDPAYYLTHLQTGSEYLSWVALKDGVKAPAFIPPAKYAVIHRAALDTCDAIDGVKDGAIEDPAKCDFDPASIQCPGADVQSCLTTEQVTTARRLYRGATFADGSPIYPGFEPGSELGWGAMIQGPEPLDINNGFFKFIAFENPDWDYHTFDVDLDTRYIDAHLGPVINSTKADLSAFKAHGGKLIMYMSWGEPWVPPRGAIDYYSKVTAAMGGEKNTADFLRLFMVPDMFMCPGMNPATFDALSAVQHWKEQGIAPDMINVSYTDGGRIYKTHPACPWPQAAIYKGSGDTNEAANFYCGVPDW